MLSLFKFGSKLVKIIAASNVVLYNLFISITISRCNIYKENYD